MTDLLLTDVSASASNHISYSIPTILIFAGQGKEKVGQKREYVTSGSRLDTIAWTGVPDWPEPLGVRYLGLGFAGRETTTMGRGE
jgi:hypothetical protein